MRILHFFKTYLPDNQGGIEQVINQLAAGSVKLGVKSDVLSLSKLKVARRLPIDGHFAYRAREDLNIASTGLSISVFLRFAQLAQRADIIHYHFPWPLMDVVHFATKLQVQKPTVLTYHSDIVKQKQLLKLYRPLQNQFLSSVDRIVATSPNYLDSSAVLRRFEHKVDIIPIGLDKSGYPKPPKNRLAYWQRKVGTKFYLFVGVLRYYKGLHLLIEAAKTANYPIVIVGAGPIEAELKQQVSSYRLSNVIFLGRVSDIDKVALLALSYAVVFPSHLRSEAFGISLLEGAMYGKPMISSEIGTGTSFINIGEQTGMVIPPSDVNALAQAMTWLWENPSEAKQMGEKAHLRYQKLFTADKMVSEYYALYKDLLVKKER